MAGLLDRVLPNKAYTHYDGWVAQPEIRVSYKPRNTVAQRAQSVFGMDPDLPRYDPVKAPYGRMSVRKAHST